MAVGPARPGAQRARPGRRPAAAVGAYKPDPRIYRHALAELAADPATTWLVAAHWWDVTGAERAGLRTARVGRDEAVLLATVPAPDVAAPDVAGAAEGILTAT